jgi:hypothetical protein
VLPAAILPTPDVEHVRLAAPGAPREIRAIHEPRAIRFGINEPGAVAAQSLNRLCYL